MAWEEFIQKKVADEVARRQTLVDHLETLRDQLVGANKLRRLAEKEQAKGELRLMPWVTYEDHINKINTLADRISADIVETQQELLHIEKYISLIQV